ncbi:CAP domain-containing protein [uncultured Winogradskyella sp.]|uniref:CAP domain-containing protein n=1 Tax=uncultured Winogradskyella sp. TaxID=395353 RepID=UPI00261BF9DB|nr:CAP domain-containing protein [uncultured Winogradskyella sp.]
MKNLSLTFTVLVFNLLLFSCSVEEDYSISEAYNSDNFNVVYEPIDYEILEFINIHRAMLNLQPLELLNEASKEAISHNYYMIDEGTVSHDFFFLRSQNLIDAVDAKKVLENVGFGFYNAQSVVDAWLDSDGHRQNIENPNVTNIGISSTHDENGKYYFTNIFVKL